MKKISIAAAAVLGIASSSAFGQTTVDLGAAKDNTLYQVFDGSLSNGAGQYMFSGLTGGASIRRCVIEFDIAGSIPAGATIDSVTLSLQMSRTTSGASNVGLYPVSQEWGEGTSNAGGQEGGGTASTNGDCTWVHAFFDTGGASVFWANAGGDYAETSSATTSVVLDGQYDWTSAQMAADVQGWLDDDSTNHGWILLNDEKVPSAKRFNTRENPTPSTRPVLTVTYTEAAVCEADLNNDGVLDFFDVQAFLQAFATQDPIADFTDDGVFDFFDVQAFLQAFAAGCP
jgi:hypothetical protein